MAVMDHIPAHLPQAQTLFGLIDILLDAANVLAEERRARAAKAAKAGKRPARSIGTTLRPGPDTVLWNAVVGQLAPYVSRRGNQAKLGRVLGVPRQRIHAYFVARTQMPDAERLLILLTWWAVEMGETTKTSPVPLA